MSEDVANAVLIHELREALDLVLDELERHRAANSAAAQAFVQKDAQIGILESQLGILQDASRPAATILFNLAQMPAIDDRTRETILQTLAPLDAALATRQKARNE
jgi:CTP:molybdopterin cytidylyltransferase MocA